MAPIRLLLAVVAVAALAVACSDDDSTTEGRQDPAAALPPTSMRKLRHRDDVDVDGPSSNSPTTTPSTTTTTIPALSSTNSRSRSTTVSTSSRISPPAGPEVTTKIPCDEPHDAQIFSRLSYPAEPGELYPGDDIVEDYALAACYLRFEAWADAIYETSALEIRAFTPTRDDFEAQSYRGIQCFVERNDGDKLVGTSRSSGL